MLFISMHDLFRCERDSIDQANPNGSPKFTISACEIHRTVNPHAEYHMLEICEKVRSSRIDFAI